MKKEINRNSNRDSGKRYIKKFRIYPSFLYGRLDKWLKKMSLKGWHIVHCGIFYFVFEEGKPQIKEYFTYGLSTQEGKYNISLMYPFLEKTFGVKAKKSKINSNRKKSCQIVEIDLNKIDVERDIAYKELIKDRNRLYMKYFIRNLTFVSIAILILVVCLIFNEK